MVEYAIVFVVYGDHRYLHVLTHSCPTRRPSDLHLVDVPVKDLPAEDQTTLTLIADLGAMRPIHQRIDKTVHDTATAEAQIGRAHVRTPVTTAHLVCRLLLEKKITSARTASEAMRL